MNEFTLYTFTGDALFDIVPEASSSHEWVLMSENRLSLTFELEQCVNLSPGCYIDFDGVRYYLLEEYKPQMVNSTAWKYNVDLRDAASWMSVTLALNLLDGKNTPIFNYTAPALEHAQIIVDNLNRSMGTTAWKVGSVISTANITIEYRAKYCSDVLQEIVDDQNTEWWLDGMTLNIGRAEFGDAVELGYGNGLLGDIVCEQADNMRTYAYLCPIGSTRNIDPTKYGFERLQLPNGQTLVPMNPEQGIGELAEEKAFSKIFPRYEGTVKSVRSRPAKGDDGREFTIYYIGVALPFNPNEYEIAGLVKQITFLSEPLMGQDFEVNYDEEAQEFEIVTRWPKGGGAQLPGGLLTPEVGDKYVIWNITMPDVYYTLASQEFLEAAEAFAAEAIQDVSIYKAPLDYIEVQERGLHLRPGQRVRLLSDAYFASGYYESRITRITRDVLLPDAPNIEVSAVRAIGTISRIQNSILSNEKNITNVSNSIPDVITSSENTPASDTSVYTSAKSEREFLNKHKGGAVNGPITFSADLKSSDFDDSPSGRGFCITKDENGNTVLTTDKLKVRMEAEFEEIVINQTSFQLGSTVFSLAGCEITSVETIGDVFRCYYDNKNGQKFSGFEVGDQARCQRYDAQYNSIIKYYWRVVKAVGEDYVDLYIGGVDGNGLSLADGAGVPTAGDHIVHFGSRRNTARQNAIVISSTPSPAIIQYIGISSFTLPSPSTVISPDGNKFSGAVHIGEGSTGIENLKGLPDAVQDVISKMDLDIDTDSLEFGKYNLLRNSGFTGDYLSAQLQGGKGLNDNSQMFSPSLEHWTVSNCVAQASNNSESGFEVAMANGAMSQTLKNKILVGENYVLSLKAKGTSLTFSVGGVSKTIALTDEYTRYVEKFTATTTTNIFSISANATICEVQLERGTVVSAWGHSMWDNQSELAYYQSLQYLASAMKDGSTTILGGLILSQLIALGNYKNGEMTKVTSGINGLYNDDDDVAFWAGGDLEKAILTVQKHRDNPLYQPTEEEWDNMAKFVTTHGGDVFMKGYIYALGGLFKGTVSIANGKILLNADGSGAMANGAFSWDTFGRITRYYPERENWIDLRDATTMSHDDGGFFISPLREISEDVEPISDDGNNVLVIPTPTLSPYVFCIKGRDGGAPEGYASKPFTTDSQKVLFRVYGKAETFVAHNLNMTALPNQGTITVEYDSTPDDYNNTYYNITLPLTMDASYTSFTDTIEIL